MYCQTQWLRWDTQELEMCVCTHAHMCCACAWMFMCVWCLHVSCCIFKLHRSTPATELNPSHALKCHNNGETNFLTRLSLWYTVGDFHAELWWNVLQLSLIIHILQTLNATCYGIFKTIKMSRALLLFLLTISTCIDLYFFLSFCSIFPSALW